MAVEVDERCARQRCRLDADPEEPERLAHGHQRHRREEEEEAGGERRLGGIVEQESLLEILPLPGQLPTERGDAIEGGRQEERARDAQKEPPRGIEGQPAAPPRRRLGDPRAAGDRRVGHGREDKQGPAGGVRAEQICRQRGEHRNQQEREDHRTQSLRAVS